MLDAQEEARAMQQAEENPFAAMQSGIVNGYRSELGINNYSRYEIAAAWGSIRVQIADMQDFAFSVALNDTVLEVGDLQQTPFEVFLTYVGTPESAGWAEKQMRERPDYIERVKQILEESLQTPVDLKIKSRAYNEAELTQKRMAQMSPYELDLQNDDGLRLLKEQFKAELIYSRKIQKVVPETDQQSDSDASSSDD